MRARGPVTVVVARFEDLVDRGLRALIEVRDLTAAHPATRLIVLANRPTPAECNQMLAFGATACLSKETQARDIVNAIHLASRGMHVLPRVPEHADAPQ